MKEYWLYGVFAAALASPPAHLRAPRINDGTYETFTLPVVIEGRQYAMFSFCDQTAAHPDRASQVGPPFASVYVAYPNKQFFWKDTKPQDFGLIRWPLEDPAKLYLGTLHREHVKSIDEWVGAIKKYNQLLSLVLERQWLLTAHPTTSEERATARELQDCTRVLYDKPLQFYYQHEGRQFLAWMARAAK